MTTALPNWVIDLVNAVEKYEHDHSKEHTCLRSALGFVPEQIREQARGVRYYLAQQQRAALENHVAANLDDVLGGLDKGPREMP